MSHFAIRQNGRKVGRLHDTREGAIAQAVELAPTVGTLRIWRVRSPLLVATVTPTAIGQPPRVARYDD